LLKHVISLNGFLKYIIHTLHFRSHKVLLSYNSGLAQHLLQLNQKVLTDFCLDLAFS